MKNTILIVIAISLCGCESSADAFVALIKELQAECEQPISLEATTGPWGNTATVKCGSVKPIDKRE